MVEISGAKPVGEGTAVSRVAAPVPIVRVAATTDPAPSPTSPGAGDVAQTSGLAQSMAASAPVDADRVAKIKRAIAEGRFPILPATIADRLIALKLQWNPSDRGASDEA